jgi:Tn7-like transposition protein D/TniQ
MLASFPSPYPDELFYSICARYSERMRYPTRRAVIKDLFSSLAVVATIALPSRLATLVDKLPTIYNYSADKFIDEHTLFPLLRPFLSHDRILYMREDMKGEKGASVYMRSGITSCSIPSPKAEHLRFCPICINEDRNLWGECYWHRIHQASGVEVCSIHKTLLHKVSSDILKTTSQIEFLSAEKVVDQFAPTAIDVTDFCQATLLNIALDVSWIINQPNLSCNSAFFEQRYHMLLTERGLAKSHARRKFNILALLQEFKAHYPPRFLQMLSCELADHETNNWLVHLLYNKGNLMHPLYHLLLIHFLGYNIETFVRLPSPPSPFGDGPWYCLNPASQHYRQKVVHDCSLSVSYASGKRPKGVFSCECGFVYSRIGPDSCEDDTFKIGKILAVGPVWEEVLRKLWKDPTVTSREMAGCLGLHRHALRCHAGRLGLSFPRPGGILLQPTRKIQVHQNGSSIDVETREYYRLLWLNIIRDNPGVGAKILKKKEPRMYTWLYRHDRSWQIMHMPQKQKQTLIDWSEYDKQTAEKISAIALQIRSSEIMLERVTSAAIMRHIEESVSLKRYLAEGKLPLTKQILNSIVEPPEEFIIRRIWWTKDVYLRERYILPKRWVFASQTGYRNYYQIFPKVREAFDAAMQSLEAFYSF